MIFKHEIVDAVNSLGLDLAELASRVHHLEERVTELEKKAVWEEEIAWLKGLKKSKACPKKAEKKTKTTAKRGPGRPRKVSK